MADRSNEDWVRILGAGGPEQPRALAELRTALLRGLRSAFTGRVGAMDDSFLEDTVQDAMLRILDRLSQFEGRSRFLTWATSIAVNTAMSELRRQRWRDVSLDALLAGSPTNSVDRDPSTPDGTAARRALVTKMHEVIASELTERQRTALLAELRGMPQDEIARQLGSNRNALYKLTHDARKRLRRGLERAGYAAPDVQSALAS